MVYVVPILSTTTTSTSLSVQPSNTSKPIPGPSVSHEVSDTGSGSRTQLAGPIAGSLAGLAVIIIAALFFWRRRRTRETNSIVDANQEHFEKPQLHSDCIPKPLFEVTGEGIHEMEGSGVPLERTAEKPANEIPAQELPSEGTRSKDTPDVE